jgi:hypothetical protein
MNHEKIYKELIERAKSSNRVKGDTYYEKHHILPKCLGGTNKKDNLVLLTAKEHFIAHLLLVEMYDGIEKAKLSFALFQMCRKNKIHGRIISSKQFEKAKQIMSENCTGVNSSFYGKTHTDAVKQKLRERMIGDDNPSKNGVWNKNKRLPPLSDEHKAKMSKSLIGKKRSEVTKLKMSNSHKNKKKSDEHKLNLSKSLMGRKLTSETKQKMSNSRKNKKQKILVCPYCIISGGTTMYRWHFENCKNKL